MDEGKEILEAVSEEIQEHKVNERLQLGYTREQWRKLNRCHVAMDSRLETDLVNYLTEKAMMELEKKPTEDELNMLYTRYSIKWRSFVKDVILNAYPMSRDKKTQSQVRLRLLNVFPDRVKGIEAKSKALKESKSGNTSVQ